MEPRLAGNLNEVPSPNRPEGDWKQISITSESLDNFNWIVISDERWEDPHRGAYQCHRITRKAPGMGGYLYSVATHILPHSKSLAPSVSESLIFVPDTTANSS